MRHHRLSASLRGHLPALPRPLDAASERWSALRPRVRLLLATTAIMAAVGIFEARVIAAESRWGGAGVDVLIAARDLSVGDSADVESATYPPQAVPSGAVADVSADASLALALPEGAVLTESHIDPAGPAAGLDDDLRVVPFPVERGWNVTEGGRVDVWVLGMDDEPATQIARARPVLELAEDDMGRETALVGLRTDEVGPATSGIALGRVLLAHTPAP